MSKRGRRRDNPSSHGGLLSTEVSLYLRTLRRRGKKQSLWLQPGTTLQASYLMYRDEDVKLWVPDQIWVFSFQCCGCILAVILPALWCSTWQHKRFSTEIGSALKLSRLTAHQGKSPNVRSDRWLMKSQESIRTGSKLLQPCDSKQSSWKVMI